MITKCRHPSCHVMIMMKRYAKTGKRAPIEVEPSDDGNILVTGDDYEIIPADRRDELRRRGALLRKNHFATCPYANRFKPRRGLRVVK